MDEKTLARETLAKLTPEQFDRVNELAEATRFESRRYGTTVYTWANHDALGIIDPWPASRFPKSILCAEFARKLGYVT